MNGKRKILSVLFSLFLTLSALPAGAVSFNSTHSVNRFNTAGTSFVDMTNRNTTFCYLSNVSIEETDSSGEEATCRVRRGVFFWRLEAILDETNDADAECSAICYNN